MRGVAFLLLYCLCIEGAFGRVYSCNEIKYNFANSTVQFKYPYACIVWDSTVDNASIRHLHLLSGTKTYSFAEVAYMSPSAPKVGGCVASTDGEFMVYSDIPIGRLGCSEELSLIFSKEALQPINLLAMAQDNSPLNSGYSSVTTLVSPYGGMRLSEIKCSQSDGTVSFYTGTELSPLYQTALYCCSDLPAAYIAFENVISIVPIGVSLSLRASLDYTEGAPIAIGEKATVTLSGRDQSIQSMHPTENSALFHFRTTAIVNATGTVDLSSGLTRGFRLRTQSIRCNTSKTFTSNFNWAAEADDFVVEILGRDIPQGYLFDNKDHIVINFNVQPGDDQDGTTTIHHVERTTSPFTTTPSTRTPSTPPTDATSTPVPVPETYCKCDDTKKVWLDIVHVIDTSAAMGAKGKAYILAVIRSVLVQLNLPGVASSDDILYSRAALIAYAKDVQLVANFTELTSDTIYNFPLPNMGDEAVNVTGAIDQAIQLFEKSTQRPNVKRVILVGASAFNGEISVGAEEFKENGGTIIVFNFVQPGEVVIPDLKKLASPGYFFTNGGDVNDFTFTDLLQAYCDVNCFCHQGLKAYTINTLGRTVPDGGCYDALKINMNQPDADAECMKDNGTLATIHDDRKQFFVLGLLPSKSQYWIGLKRNNAGFTWEDNSTIPFTHLTNPNAAGDCVYSQQTSGFTSTWYTGDCNHLQLYFICQYKPCHAAYNCF